MSKTSRYLFNGLICAASFVGSLVIAEAYCRAYLPEVSDSFIIRLNEKDIMQKYHHEPVMKQSLESPDPEAFRILFLGDSFTYGVEEPEESFPYLVEQYFNEEASKNPAARRIQVFNLGVVSYSPSIYGVLLRDYEPVLKPDLVVIAPDDSDPQDDFLYRHMLVKDQSGLPRTVYPTLPGVPRWLLPYAKKIKVLRMTLGMIDETFIRAIKSDGEEEVALYENRIGHYRKGSEDVWREAFERSLNLIDAMVRYCHERNIPTVLLNYPYPPAVTLTYSVKFRETFEISASELSKPLFHGHVRGFARQHSIPYYDFTDYLRTLDDHTGIFQEEGGHFTGKGNALFAAEIVNVITPIILGSESGLPE